MQGGGYKFRMQPGVKHLEAKYEHFFHVVFDILFCVFATF